MASAVATRQPALLAAGEGVRVGVGEPGQAQPLQQLVHRAGDCGLVPAGPARAEGQLVDTRPVTNWCSGSWNTEPIRRASRAARHRCGWTGVLAGQRAVGRTVPDVGASAGRRAAGPASTCRRRWTASRRPPAGAWTATEVGGSAGRAPGDGGGRAGARRSGARRRRPGPRSAAARPVAARAPTRPGGERRAVPAKTASGAPSARTPPPASITTTRSTSGSASATRCSTITVVAAVRACSVATASPDQGAPAGSRLAVGSSSSSSPGRRASTPAMREALLLAAGERVGAVPERVAEADRVERRPHPRPDLRRPARRGSPARTPRRRRTRAMTSRVSGSWKTMPARSRTPARVGSGDHDGRPPPRRRRPGRAARPSAASSVLLPAPEAPSSSTRSPGSTTRSTPRTAQARRAGCRHPKPRASTRTPLTGRSPEREPVRRACGRGRRGRRPGRRCWRAPGRGRPRRGRR